jgi:hypothetical protein
MYRSSSMRKLYPKHLFGTKFYQDLWTSGPVSAACLTALKLSVTADFFHTAAISFHIGYQRATSFHFYFPF